MKICFVWPFKNMLISESTESNEFYQHLRKKENITMVDNFEDADYIFYMMDIRNCYNMPYYNLNDLDESVLNKIKNNKQLKKEVIIDYNDWTDTRNVDDNILSQIAYYFKRSIVDKQNLSLINYDREIIPISYGIRSDFIEYDKIFEFKEYNYDICCLFNKYINGFRSIIPDVVNKYKGDKYIGVVYCSEHYNNVSTEYFKILKTSKIIVTANPTDWEGDFRLWEALLMGNLVLCDKMIVPHILKKPLVNKKHLVFYENIEELENLIDYYIKNNKERTKIGKEGRDYCLKYHKFSDRVDEVINHLKT